MESSTDLNSDHTPVILTLSDTIIYKEPSPSLTNNKTDWKNYSNYLEKNIVLNVPLKTQDQIENEARLFTTQLQLAAKESTLILKKIKPGINYSIEVKELVREKRKARKAWQKTRDPEKKTIFNNLNQKLKRLTYELKNQGITKYLQGLSAEKDFNYFPLESNQAD